jgi:hypothetical protein
MFVCRKCIIKAICTTKCDKIRSYLHILSIIQSSVLITLCLTWALGFGLLLTNGNKHFIFWLWATVLVGSILSLFKVKQLRDRVNLKFGRYPVNHISKWV